MNTTEMYHTVHRTHARTFAAEYVALGVRRDHGTKACTCDARSSVVIQLDGDRKLFGTRASCILFQSANECLCVQVRGYEPLSRTPANQLVQFIVLVR